MLLSASSTSTLTYCRRSATRELWLCRKLAPRSDCRLWNKLIPLTMRIRAQVTHKTVLYSGSRWRCALSTVKYILGLVLVGDRRPERRAGQANYRPRRDALRRHRRASVRGPPGTYSSRLFFMA